MAYLALYRKHRPTSFDGVIGQEHITTSLKNQIKNNAISHAYLFCGTRGTGKTSVAKIFARAINCTNPVNGSACGKCETCKALLDPSNLDILEIDAASNNRVDEIRELREKVKYPPVNGRYKVYIIDEVHMLTDSAFNALLKTLEEPPSYVVFILATTEVQKLPATILSRCLRFDFKLVSTADLTKHLKNIFDADGIKYEEEALSLIATLGEGSVRDTLSIADMCVAFTNKNVTYESVLKAVGAIDKKSLGEIAKLILLGDKHMLLSKINDVCALGKNVTQLSKDLAGFFRDLAVIKTCENYKEILKYPENNLKMLVEIAGLTNTDNILKALKTFASLDNEFRLTNNPRIVLEVAAIGVCDDIKNGLTLLERIEALEAGEHKSVSKNLTVAEAPQVVMQNPKLLPEEKTIFGKLLVTLRKMNELMLISLLGENTSYKLENNILKLVSCNEVEFNTLSKSGNLKTLNNAIKQIDESFSVTVEYVEKQHEKTVEEILKEKFGNDIKI